MLSPFVGYLGCQLDCLGAQTRLVVGNPGRVENTGNTQNTHIKNGAMLRAELW